MSYSLIQRRLKLNLAYLTVSSTDVSISINDTVAFSSPTDLIGATASGYSVNSGVITLPSGYWYLLKSQLMGRLSDRQGYIKHIWRDSSNNDLGRRGTLIMQEEPHAFGGDEIAVALVDCTSASKDVKVSIESLSNVNVLNYSLYTEWVGGMRAEIWRLG
jgi:hypothetical protein